MELSPGSLATCQTSSPLSMPVSSSPVRNSFFIDVAHPRRKQVEQFIAGRFLKVHGARLSSFMPLLVALFDENGEVRAAVGIRNAAVESLFLEYYLDTSIEQAISTMVDLAPSTRVKEACTLVRETIRKGESLDQGVGSVIGLASVQQIALLRVGQAA